MSERLKNKKMYRNNRRNRLRHRKPRFDNRKIAKGWFAPSLEHKLDRRYLRVEGPLEGIDIFTNLMI